MEKIEVCFQVQDEEISDILTAELSELGYDSFWIDENGFRGYIHEEVYNVEELDSIVKKYNNLHELRYTITKVSPQGWDKSNSDSLHENYLINDFVEIASDAKLFTNRCEHQIVMNANLAFGRGDHPSTHNCLESMNRISFVGKTVFDLGSGTAILAILAEKLGASKVGAIDNNPWAFKVANEAVALNACTKIEILEGELEDLKEQTADIVLANLNMDVFRNYFSLVAALVHSQGWLMISGFMKKDEIEMIKNLIDHGLEVYYRSNYEDWITIIARHKKSH